MLRPAGTIAVGRGFAGAPAIVGVGVPAVLRAWPVAAGAASGSAWACVSVPGWVATAAGGAASLPGRAVRRVRRCHLARWAGRARWCRRRLPWRVGGRGETHRTPGSGRVPCRFGPRCRSRGSMRLLRTGAVGCSPAWCMGRSGRRGGVGVARAVSRHWRGRSRVGSGVGGQPGPGRQGSRLRALVWGQARVRSAVDGRGSGPRLSGRAASAGSPAATGPSAAGALAPVALAVASLSCSSRGTSPSPAGASLSAVAGSAAGLRVDVSTAAGLRSSSGGCGFAGVHEV